MSIAQLSPNSVLANPADINPLVRAEQVTSTPQAAQDAQKTAKVAKTDTVTISSAAVKMLKSDGDSAAQEVNESGAEKSTETFRTVA